MSKNKGLILDGSHVRDPAVLRQLAALLEEEGPLIVEHRHFGGGRPPTWYMVSEEEELQHALMETGIAGDSFWIWSFLRVCTDDNAVYRGRIPDKNGKIPEGGGF